MQVMAKCPTYTKTEALPWWFFPIALAALASVEGASRLARGMAGGAVDGLDCHRFSGWRRIRLVLHPADQRRPGMDLPRVQHRFRLAYELVWLVDRQVVANQRSCAARIRRAAGVDILCIRQGAHRIHTAARSRPADREHSVARLGFAGAHQGGRAQGAANCAQDERRSPCGRDFRFVVFAPGK